MSLVARQVWQFRHVPVGRKPCTARQIDPVLRRLNTLSTLLVQTRARSVWQRECFRGASCVCPRAELFLQSRRKTKADGADILTAREACEIRPYWVRRPPPRPELHGGFPLASRTCPPRCRTTYSELQFPSAICRPLRQHDAEEQYRQLSPGDALQEVRLVTSTCSRAPPPPPADPARSVFTGLIIYPCDAGAPGRATNGRRRLSSPCLTPLRPSTCTMSRPSRRWAERHRSR